ncbi:MAG: hypothetical protein OXC40_08095 [Proteobacteria bacterium]|nr:hypothetical protein [Pseudomonadota bacterium]
MIQSMMTIYHIIRSVPMILIVLPMALLLGSGVSYGAAEDTNHQQYLSFHDRHVIIFASGYGEIYMSYFFAVKNNHSKAIKTKIPFIYPLEMMGVEALSGLTNNDLVFDDQTKKIVIEKSFAPGGSIIALRFSVPSGRAKKIIRFAIPYATDNLSFLRSVEETLRISVPDFLPGVPADLQGSQLVGVVSKDLVSSTNSFKVTLEDLPEDRRRFYLLAMIFVTILLTGGLMLLWIK